MPKVEAVLAALDSSRVKRLAEGCINLVQSRKLVKSVNSALIIRDLPHYIVSYIASFIHPKGISIGNNVSNFFYVRRASISPLANLKIDISKVEDALGISHVESRIQKVLKGYFFDSTLTPKEKKTAAKNLFSALENIEKEDDRTLVWHELTTLGESEIVNKWLSIKKML